MPKQPLISVIVPVYNGATYLPRCIESIQQQTYPHWELLLIDDGSTDTSLKICREYATKNNRIRVMSQKNQGVCAARNTGIEQARGEFLTFADQDDLLPTNDIFFHYVEIALATKADIICGEWKVLFQDNSTQFPPTAQWAADLTGNLCAEEFLYKICARQEGSIWNRLYRREIIGNIRCRTDLRLLEDFAFLLDILPQVHHVFHTNKVVYNWFQRQNSTLHVLVFDISVRQKMMPVFQQAYQLCLERKWSRALGAVKKWYLSEMVISAFLIILFDKKNQFTGFYKEIHQVLTNQKRLIFSKGLSFRVRIGAFCLLFFPTGLLYGLRSPGIRFLLQQKLVVLLSAKNS